MNILGVSYKRDVQNAEWKSIQPLQCERKQGSLTEIGRASCRERV